MSNKYIFIIDTDSYAGNFERDMCAYLTGVVGDCGVGEEFAELYKNETNQEESIFLDYLEHRADDHGCFRPTSIWPTKGLSDKITCSTCSRRAPNNSVAIFFEKKPTKALIMLMKERADKFVEAKRQLGASYEKDFKLTIYGFRLVKETITSTEEEV